MKLHDQHLHSRHSLDSQADPVANCEQAVARGLSGLTFTEHYNPHPDEWELYGWDYAAISDTIAELRERFAGKLRIGFGIEVCYQPITMDKTLDYLETDTFDFVLLSVHWADGKPMHLRECWDGWDAERLTRAYLENVLSAMKLCRDLEERGRRPFHVLGHLDLVKRYAHRYWGSFDIRAHRDLVDEIWRTAIAAGVIPEINTSSWRGDVGEPMPAAWAIERYAQLGGREMSLGSDAHKPEHIAADFDRAVDILNNAGIENEAVFLNRQMERISLS